MLAATVMNAAGGKKGGGVFSPTEFYDLFPTLATKPDPEADSAALISALKARGARDLRGANGRA